MWQARGNFGSDLPPIKPHGITMPVDSLATTLYKTTKLLFLEALCSIAV